MLEPIVISGFGYLHETSFFGSWVAGMGFGKTEPIAQPTKTLLPCLAARTWGAEASQNSGAPRKRSSACGGVARSREMLRLSVD